jgi:hypothetical protein
MRKMTRYTTLIIACTLCIAFGSIGCSGPNDAEGAKAKAETEPSKAQAAHFKRNNLYTIRFTAAAGVGPGTPVRRSSVRIGEVQDVTLDDERGVVRVRVAIDPRFAIHRNEQPRLNVSPLGGDAIIDFVPVPAEEGQPVDRSVLEPGSEIVGVRPDSVRGH